MKMSKTFPKKKKKAVTNDGNILQENIRVMYAKRSLGKV